MFSKSFTDCERERFKNLGKLQLPNWMKKFGIGLAILAFLFLFVNKFTADAPELRMAAKYGLLVGFLLISVSRDQIEDELITKLRMQSYSFAFIIGVVITLVQPFINFFVDDLVKPGSGLIKDTGDFEVLWMLLSIQVFVFEMLKRLHR